MQKQYICKNISFTERYFAVKYKYYQTETVYDQPITCTLIIIGKDTTIHPESVAALVKQVLKSLGYTSKLESQCSTTKNKQTRKAQNKLTELNIQEIDDQTEEISSIPVNKTTNSNAGTQDTSIKHKKKHRQKFQVKHGQKIQAQMNTQTQLSQVIKNIDNTYTNQ
ncbi:Hypothetical_protein [Hexamita inflata]|uniref:Hypothetical_protein n=1 Tax=Hexamita inflata TaxID=28002 RepID=A0AA86P066_9EUKA|nr:Hypothetical protein HINF_LOCUS16761 [Hexamita inflata]